MVEQEKEIAITGANGRIGTVLREGISNYQISPLDLPEIDVRNYNQLLDAVGGHAAIIHLAWAYDEKTDHDLVDKVNPDNFLMYTNVYRAALSAGIPRVLMASSVLADDFYNYREEPSTLDPNRWPIATGPYGANKTANEMFGRYYSTKGLEVVSMRIGAIREDDQPLEDSADRSIYISHRDLVSFVQKALDADSVPNNFGIYYVVSNNPGRKQNVSNPFGWTPQDSAESR